MTEEKPVILKDYTLIKDIGEGNFGKVKLSILNSTKEKYAIKILDKEKLKSQTKSTLFNEIEIISKLRHPNLIYVDKILEDEKSYYIIMEYCEKGELFDYIVEKERLDPIEASIFFYQLINGVDYIHKHGFAHRDLKPENLLLTKNKILKIIDFGLCHDFDENKFLHTKCGSPSYAAPEILKGYPYDGFKTDIWCCGIILYAMLCGYLPFDGDDNQEIFQSIVDCEPEFPTFLEDDSINLLIWLLNPEPKERITIEEIKCHPFYIKGKTYYSIQYGESDDITDDDKTNEMKDNNLESYNSIEKKGFGFSTIRRKKGNIYTFNNIKRLRMNENKHFKNNVYQNIYNNIANLNDDENSIKFNSKNTPHIITSINNNENKKNNIEPKKIGKNENLKNAGEEKIKKFPQILETELNQDKSSSLFGANNKLISNTFINKNGKKELSFVKNNNEKYKLMTYNESLSPKLPNYKSIEKKIDNNNYINTVSLDIKKHNQYKSLEKRKNQKIILKHNNKFLEENIKYKTREKQNNQDTRINDQLDFFQKFCINKNKADSLEKSPRKNFGINCNLVLTKGKEKNTEKRNEEINKNEDLKDIRQRQISGNKNNISIKDRIILTTKKRNFDSIRNDPIFSNKISLINSPAQNINHFYQRNNKKSKFINSIFGYNNANKNEKNSSRKPDSHIEKNNIEWKSYSIKKDYEQRNLKSDINRKLNNLKIVNLSPKCNTIKKEAKRNNFINKNPQDININNNLLSLNVVLKTEPKSNHFLEKVIQKLNSNKDRKPVKNNMKIIMTHSNKNEENKQIYRFLSLEKNNNNNEILGSPLVFKYCKNNLNEEDLITRKSPTHFKEEKIFLHTINPKLLENSINRKSKERIKKKFPNFIVSNKK